MTNIQFLLNHYINLKEELKSLYYHLILKDLLNHFSPFLRQFLQHGCNPLLVFSILSSYLLVVAVTMDKVETVIMTTSPPLISEIVAFGRLRDGSGV